MSMLIFILLCVGSIAGCLTLAFFDYRDEKGLLGAKGDIKRTIMQIVTVIICISAVISFISNFKTLSIIILAVTFAIDFTIVVILDLWLIADEFDGEGVFNVSIGTFVVAVVVVSSMFGLYYGAVTPKNMELVSQEIIETNKISVEKRLIKDDDVGKVTPEETYFALIDYPNDKSNKYIFYHISDLDETETKVSVRDDSIKITYIDDGQQPYYEKVEYVYVGQRQGESLHKWEEKKYVYNVYIPESDILTVEKSQLQ